MGERLTTNQSQPELEFARNRVLIRDEETRFQSEHKRRINEFNTHLTSLVTNDLVNRSKVANHNAAWFFMIVFPDIQELTGINLVVPLSIRKWPHYNYDEIVEYIKATYPEITSPSFNVHSFRLQINVDGRHLEQEPTLQDPKNNSTELPKVATVELRYKPLREPVPSIEEILKAGAAGSARVPVPVQEPVAGSGIPKHLLDEDHNNWDYDQWNEEWEGPAVAAAVPAAPAPAPRLPNTSHPPPFRDPVSGLLMVYDPVAGFYHTGTAPPAPSPPILPNGGNQTGNYGGRKKQSKRGKKKSKSKSKTKKSKSKSKRNKRRSYKRVK